MLPTKFYCACIAVISTMVMQQLAIAQIPTIIDPNIPPLPAIVDTPQATTTAAISKLEVSCKDLKTIVQKDDRRAVMMTWLTNYFGREFNNAKRCQVVSERLQQAANRNGGSFQGLQLATGTVNAQAVVCVLPNNGKQCDRDNMLFTLKPENAGNPEAVIQKILSFADGSGGSIEESARSKTDLNLGNWERKVFGTKPKSPSKPALKVNPGGF
jgi:hypothetical protein